MKKIAAFLFVLSSVAFAQVTPNIDLNLPNYASSNWNVPLNQNFTILDNYLGGVNSFPNPLKASITGSSADLSGGALGSVPYQSQANTTLFVAPNTTTTPLYLCETGTGTAGAAPTWCSGSGGGGVSSFSAPSANWPSWLVPSVATPTSTPVLSVTASAIPNSALANDSVTVNGTTCTLGSSCAPGTAAGSLTGTTLASNVVNSSLTSVGIINTGTWQGTPIANNYLANNYISINGTTCTLGSPCTTTSGTATNLAGGSLGSISYQSAPSTTLMLAPNTTAYTYYLCETGTGSVGAAPQWCAGTSPGGTVTNVGLSMPSGQFTVSGSPVTTSGTLTVTLNSPSGTGNIVLNNSPSIAALTVTGSLTATGLVTNADLVNQSTTVNGQTCTLGGSCTVTASATGITVGTTTVSGGTTGYVLYDNAGTLGNLATTGSGSVVLATSPTLVTPLLGTPTSGVITNLTGTCTSCTASQANTINTVAENSNVAYAILSGPLTSGYQGPGTVSGFTINGSTLLLSTPGAISTASTGNVKSGYFSSSTANPTITANAAAGTSPTIGVVGTNFDGYISLTTGTGTTSNAQLFTLTFATPFASGYTNCIMGAASATSSGADVYVNNDALNEFTVSVGATALAASTGYQWSYICAN